MRFKGIVLSLLGAMFCAMTSYGAEGQIALCMIGDSITWANQGDYWRRYLVESLPELGFVGTHTARLGYSHAGEGGNNTEQVLRRLDDLSSIPLCRNYHVLIGVNNNAAAKCEADVERVALHTKGNIVKIVRQLEARPQTGRIFLGSLLPCSHPTDPEAMKYRDLANQAVNRMLRREFKELFPSGKVIWVEYEPTLRALPDWRRVIELHPSKDGYAVIAGLLVPYLRKHAVREPKLSGPTGVQVTNLWSEEKGQTRSGVIPGWYTLSMVANEDCDRLRVTLETLGGKVPLRFPFKKAFRRDGVRRGQRVQFNFFTGYEGYGYSMGVMALTGKSCAVSQIQLEKMRPSRQASVYGTGTFVDSVSPVKAGELRVSVTR